MSPIHATRLPLSPHCNPFSACEEQPRCFPLQPVRLLASFAAMVSKSKGTVLLRPEQQLSDLLSTISTQGRLRLHTALRKFIPMHRIAGSNLLRTQAGIPHGSSSMHKSRSPRKQGRVNHAIGNRPEFASAGSALPPSTHPKLGVTSKHQRFHRYAL